MRDQKLRFEREKHRRPKLAASIEPFQHQLLQQQTRPARRQTQCGVSVRKNSWRLEQSGQRQANDSDTTTPDCQCQAMLRRSSATGLRLTNSEAGETPWLNQRLLRLSASLYSPGLNS